MLKKSEDNFLISNFVVEQLLENDLLFDSEEDLKKFLNEFIELGLLYSEEVDKILSEYTKKKKELEQEQLFDDSSIFEEEVSDIDSDLSMAEQVDLIRTESPEQTEVEESDLTMAEQVDLLRTDKEERRFSSVYKYAVIKQCKEEDKETADDKFCVYSEKGKLLGRYKTKEEAEKRLQQVEYWKKQSNISFESGDIVKLKDDRVVKIAEIFRHSLIIGIDLVKNAKVRFKEDDIQKLVLSRTARKQFEKFAKGRRGFFPGLNLNDLVWIELLEWAKKEKGLKSETEFFKAVGENPDLLAEAQNKIKELEHELGKKYFGIEEPVEVIKLY